MDASLPSERVLSHDPGCRRPLALPKDVRAWAEFGGDFKEYRYKLLHEWDNNLRRILLILMNPSAASTEISDATAAKCGRLSRRWGFGAMLVGNVCAYRATDMQRLLKVPDVIAVGPRNFEAVIEMARDSSQIIVAHGQLPGSLQRHADALVQMLRGQGFELHVLGFCGANGVVPIHPLARGRAYVSEAVVPQLWEI